MALSLVQHKINEAPTGGTSLGVTVTSTGAGNLLVAEVVTTTVAPSGVSDGTSSFTQFPSARIVGSGGFANVWVDCYYLPSSNSGKTTITITAAGTAGYIEMEVWEVSGFTTPTTDGVQTTPTSGSTGVGTTLTGPAITTTGSAGFIVANAGVTTGPVTQNPKTGNAFTTGGDVISTDGFVSLITSSAGTYTPEWVETASGDTFLSIVAAFKESTPPAPVEFITTPKRYKPIRPAQFKPMGDAFRTAKYKNWR